jgi:hypothetical protein
MNGTPAPALNVTDRFRALTNAKAAPSRLGRWYRGLPKSGRWSLAALVIVALYLMPFWPRVPVLGWIFDTPGTNFPGVLSDQVVLFVLVALGLNVVVGWATWATSASSPSGRTRRPSSAASTPACPGSSAFPSPSPSR